MKTIFRRVWLFLRIVGQEWTVGRLSISQAWTTVKIIHPTKVKP